MPTTTILARLSTFVVVGTVVMGAVVCHEFLSIMSELAWVL